MFAPQEAMITSLPLPKAKKEYNEGGYERHKIFLYKEDFNKFLKASWRNHRLCKDRLDAGF
jgi:hypothetical protein